MNGKRDDADMKLDELFAEIAREDDVDLSPEFYAHRTERVIQRMKELDAETDPGAGNEKVQKEDAGNSRKGTTRRPWATTVFSIAAVFVFLICGTFLTRGSLRGTTPPGTPGGQITVVENPGNTPGIDGSGIIDTTEVKTPEGFVGFMQDMWLFIKASFLYLCAVTAVVLLIVRVRKKNKG